MIGKKKVDILAIVWFAFTMFFLGLAIVDFIDGDASTALTFCAMSQACGARAEIQILKNQIEKMED